MFNLCTARVLDASSRFNYNSGKIYRICENGGAPKARLKSNWADLRDANGPGRALCTFGAPVTARIRFLRSGQG